MGGPIRARRVLSAVLPIVILYAVLEAGVTILSVYGVIFPVRVIRVFEASEKSILFDPVLGVRITHVPSRASRLTDGKLDLIERFEGNAQGLSDRRDFTMQRSDGDELRLAVLGDSFSAMKALDVLWPERVEDLAAADGRTVRLMNFSIGGGGLANWWSILHRMIAADGYVIDGVVFAVFDAPVVGDLHRSFLMSDHGHGGVRVGYAPSWDPATWPQTWEEAEPIVTPRSRLILSHKQFEDMVRGEYVPSARRAWKPYLTFTVLGRSPYDAEVSYSGPETTSNDYLAPGPKRLTDEIAALCEVHEWSVVVARVPSREDVLTRSPPSGVLQEFAKRLGVEIIDGVDAYRDTPTNRVHELWIPRDGHWNQEGSDAFAQMMWDRLQVEYPRAQRSTELPSTS